MSLKLNKASAIAVAASLAVAVIGADSTGAAAQNNAAEYDPVAMAPQDASQAYVSDPVVQPLPPAEAASQDDRDTQPEAAPQISAGSLSQLVSNQPQPAELSRELQCLAGAIYFEAKSESLAGQLAVGRVVVARSKSGRFPNSYCGVVYQPSQFSFVRGSAMPRINRASQDWHDAVAIAQIANAGTWRSPVEGALYFHAAYVSPNWHLRRVGRVENHIFYR